MKLPPHFVQAAPFSPQAAVAVPGTHVSPLQQPSQVFGPHGSLHTPLVHFELGEHVSQAFAPTPHATDVLPVSHLSSRQQPLQFAGVHVTACGFPFGPRSVSLSSLPKPSTTQSAVVASTFSAATRAMTSRAHVLNFA